MAIVMNMSGYEIERMEAPDDGYGDEVMCSGWNPQLALVSESAAAQTDRHITLPSGLAYVDVEVFLRKMYASQR